MCRLSAESHPAQFIDSKSMMAALVVCIAGGIIYRVMAASIYYQACPFVRHFVALIDATSNYKYYFMAILSTMLAKTTPAPTIIITRDVIEG